MTADQRETRGAPGGSNEQGSILQARRAQGVGWRRWCAFCLALTGGAPAAQPQFVQRFLSAPGHLALVGLPLLVPQPEQGLDLGINLAPRGGRLLAKPRDARASEFRRCLRMADWKCCDVVLGYFKDSTMTDDDVISIARYLEDNVSKTAKAPLQSDVMAAIVERRKNKNGTVVATNPDGSKVPAPIKAVSVKAAITDTTKLANGWRAWVHQQPQLKTRRDEVNRLINAITDAAGKLAVIGATVTSPVK